MTTLFLICVIILIFTLIFGLIPEKKDKNIPQKDEETIRKESCEYFERINQQRLSDPVVSKPARIETSSQQSRQFFYPSDLVPDYDNLENLHIPKKSCLFKNLKKQNGKVVAILKTRARIEQAWAELLKPGDKISLKKVGKATVLLYTQDSKKIDAVDYPIGKILFKMNLEGLKCVVSKVSPSKRGGVNVTVSITVDAKDFAQIEFPELARWDPLSREHFWISLNNGEFGKRQWNKKRGSVAPFCNIKNRTKEELAEIESKKIIEKRRFKSLPGESMFENTPGVDYIFVDLKGLDYRSEAAQKAAEELKMGDMVVLVPDDNNYYDINAVAVFTISGLLLGYIDKRNAEFLRNEVWEIIDSEIMQEFPRISINVTYVVNRSY